MSENDNKPVFRAFNPHAPVRVYRRNLPHWRQDGATYFVTFRLADSIPEQVILGWKDEDRTWLKANGIEGSIGFTRPGGPCYVERSSGPLCEAKWQAAYDALPEKARQTFERRAARRLHVELDKCRGSCLLRHPDSRELVAGALRHFHGSRWWAGDFVVMPNHVHGLFQPGPGHELEDVLGSVKGYVSTMLTKQGVKSGKLWQEENYDRLVRDAAELGGWCRYIERNPEKAGLGEADYSHHRCDWLDEVDKA